MKQRQRERKKRKEIQLHYGKMVLEGTQANDAPSLPSPPNEDQLDIIDKRV